MVSVAQRRKGLDGLKIEVLETAPSDADSTFKKDSRELSDPTQNTIDREGQPMGQMVAIAVADVQKLEKQLA